MPSDGISGAFLSGVRIGIDDKVCYFISNPDSNQQTEQKYSIIKYGRGKK